jgi:hypothetical protein
MVFKSKRKPPETSIPSLNATFLLGHSKIAGVKTLREMQIDENSHLFPFLHGQKPLKQLLVFFEQGNVLVFPFYLLNFGCVVGL